MSASKENVVKLREETGAGVMDCKRALEESGGDFTAAQQWIREKGLAKAAKRQDRETASGRVEAYVHDNRVGVIVEVRSETDFVANSDPFRELAHNIALQLTAMPAETVEELLEQPYIRNESQTIRDLIAEVVAQVGENIQVAGFSRREI